MHANAGPAEERAAQVPTALAVVLVVLSLLVAGGAWVAVATRGDRSASEALAPAAADVTVLPSTLAGLPTTTHLTGAEAVDAVTGLHVGDVPVDAAEIADYGGGKVLVWVSWSTASSAEDLVKEMTVKIAQGGTPFSAPREPARYDGVWVTVGNGQTHFYFARRDAVWWLAADPDLARTAVTELLGVAG
jgi:hypothetical protein